MTFLAQGLWRRPLLHWSSGVLFLISCGSSGSLISSSPISSQISGGDGGGMLSMNIRMGSLTRTQESLWYFDDGDRKVVI